MDGFYPTAHRLFPPSPEHQVISCPSEADRTGRRYRALAAATALVSAVFLLLSAQGTMASVRTFAMPAEMSWKDAQQEPLRRVAGEYLQLFDFDRISGSLLPIDPVEYVPVPDIPVDMSPDTLVKYLHADYYPDEIGRVREEIPEHLRPVFTQEFRQSIFHFSRRIAREGVVAQQAATLDDGRQVAVGTVMLRRLEDLPGNRDSRRSLAAVQDLIRAGVEEVPALINVAQMEPRGRGYNKRIFVSTPTIFERAFLEGHQLTAFQRAMDGNPFTAFERVERHGISITKRMMFVVDLGRYWRIGLIRLYPTPGSGRLIDNYTIRRGLPGTARDIPGLVLEASGLGDHGFPRYRDIIETLPTFVIAQSNPSNRRDTVNVQFTPSSQVRHFRVDIHTELDYDIAEVEAFADGFLPDAEYLSRALPLEPAVLGRMFWDEGIIGPADRSQLRISMKTGAHPEPNVLLRRTGDGRMVEWMSDAQYQAAGLGERVMVVDRRRGSETFGEPLPINDDRLRLEARALFSALTLEERLALRLSREQYLALSAANQGPVEPNTDFWGSWQPVENGEIIEAPSGMPYFQLRFQFTSTDPRASRVLNSLWFEYFADPAVHTAVGEIAPTVDVQAGADTTYVMAIRASMGPDNTGFNRLRVSTSAFVPGVDAVTVDLGDGPQPLDRITAVDPGPVEAGTYREQSITDRYFVVGLPRIAPETAGVESLDAELTLQFNTRVLGFRTDFTTNLFMLPDSLAHVPDSMIVYESRRALVMRETAGVLDTMIVPYVGVVEGDVMDLEAEYGLSDDNTLTVTADVAGLAAGLLGKVELSSRIIAPTGDGVHDELMITYDVLRLLRERPVDIAIYDLAGRRVRLIESIERSMGGFTAIWDGRDDHDRVVPPGVYVLRIRAEADGDESTVVRTVSVAY